MSKCIISFEQYRNKVKRALLARKSELDQVWDPFVASWLAYAFMYEQDAQPQLFQELFQRLDTWSQEDSAWQFKRNIGPLFFLAKKRNKITTGGMRLHPVSF